MFNFKGQTLLVIAPHPDDEVIGCAGLIQKIKNEGGKVYILFLTVGDTKDFTKAGISSLSERKEEIARVSEFLRYDDYDIAVPGNDFHLKLDKLGQKKLMDVIERESKVSLEKIKPAIVAFSSKNSYNQDHRIAALAAFASLRPSDRKLKHQASIVLEYEEPVDIWSLEKKQPPNFIVPLAEKEIDNKTKAMSLYESQDREFPNARSGKTLKTLATLRGSLIGEDFAEAFIIHRLISN